jgi:hypothetical protein
LDKPKVAARKAAPAAKPREASQSFGWFGAAPAANRPKSYGHQLTVARPPTNLAAPQTR